MLPSISFSAVSFPFLVIISTERKWAYGCENYPQIYPCMNELHTPIKTLSTSHQRELCLRAEVHTMGLWGTGDTPRSNLKERLSWLKRYVNTRYVAGKYIPAFTLS